MGEHILWQISFTPVPGKLDSQDQGLWMFWGPSGFESAKYGLALTCHQNLWEVAPKLDIQPQNGDICKYAAGAQTLDWFLHARQLWASSPVELGWRDK